MNARIPRKAPYCDSEFAQLEEGVVSLVLSVETPFNLYKKTCILPFAAIYVVESVEQDQTAHKCSLILLFTFCCSTKPYYEVSN